MDRIFRVSGFHQGKINASVEDVWALVTDWGSLAWFNDEENEEGMKLMQTWLEGDPDVVPRTRVMARDEGAIKRGAPQENREVLLVADPGLPHSGATCVSSSRIPAATSASSSATAASPQLDRTSGTRGERL